MPFRPVPGCPDWEVDNEITPDRRITFRLSEEGRLDWGNDAPMWKLKDRLCGFFGMEHSEVDRRIREENGRWSIRVSTSNGDFKLFCTPIDASVFRAIKTHWQRERWMQFEEHRLIEQCLNEFYTRGELAFDTARRLSEYEEFMKLGFPEFARASKNVIDDFLVISHKYFVVFGLNTRVPLTRQEVMELQLALNVRPSGRYGLATAKAVKTLQQKLKTEGLYKGPVNGLWNERFETAWEAYKESKGFNGVLIEELGIKIDPNRVLSETLVNGLKEVATVLVGLKEYENYLKHNSGAWIIRAGKTITTEGWRIVYIVLGDKFSEDVAWAMRIAAMLLQEKKEKTNTAREVFVELDRRGLNKENTDQMLSDIDKAITIISVILVLYGVIQSVGRKAAVQAIKKLKKEVREELYERLAEKKAKGELVDELAEEVLKRQQWEKGLAKEAVKTGKGKVIKWVRHHLFPKEFRKYFEGKIDIENWIRKVGEEFHKVMHGGGGRAVDSWNGRWRKFFKPYNGKPKTKWPTARQMENFMKKLCKEFGILLE